MKLYLYDEITKEYIETIEAYIDPEESKIAGKEVYMFPANSTDLEPPLVGDNEIVLFENDNWVIKPDYRGLYQCNKDFIVTEIDKFGELEDGYIVITEEQADKIAEDKLYYVILDGELVVNPNYEAEKAQAEAERIGNLTLTKRVFALALQGLGITYTQLKELIATNEQAQLEWDLCVELERKNPLLDIMALQLGVTSPELDYIFQKANGEDVEPPVIEDTTIEEEKGESDGL